MSATAVDLSFNKANTLGPLLFGGLASSALWGIACSQVYSYFHKFPNDPKLLKFLVPGLLAMDTFDFILTSHVVYWYLVDNYSNPVALVKPVWSILIHVAVTSISNFIVRGLFLRRVWHLSSNNRWLCGIIMAISLMDLLCGMIITIKTFALATYAELSTVSTLFYLSFASGVASDTIVAASLCYYLQRSKSDYGRMVSVVNHLTVCTINTGVITVVDAVAGLAAYAAMPNNFIFVGFYMILSKLYLNAYLASLNARQILREQNDNLASSINLSPYPKTAPQSLEASEIVNKEPSFVPHRETLEIEVRED